MWAIGEEEWEWGKVSKNAMFFADKVVESDGILRQKPSIPDHKSFPTIDCKRDRVCGSRHILKTEDNGMLLMAPSPILNTYYVTSTFRRHLTFNPHNSS